jgi:programmed cell death protein 5
LYASVSFILASRIFNRRMNGLHPASDLDPSDLPEGFTTEPSDIAAGRVGGPGGDAAHQQQQRRQQQAEIDAQKQAILEQALTADALARLRRIKLVKRDKAAHVENVIAGMAMSGKLPGPINEGKLIEMLERGNRASSSSSSAERTISIQRKKYVLDSDDDDDNDDDLL